MSASAVAMQKIAPTHVGHGSTQDLPNDQWLPFEWEEPGRRRRALKDSEPEPCEKRGHGLSAPQQVSTASRSEIATSPTFPRKVRCLHSHSQRRRSHGNLP